jgi:hypothetical protein
MSSDFLKRLEKVEELMNPADNGPKFRIELVFINPDGTIAGTRIIGPDEPGEDKTD